MKAIVLATTMTIALSLFDPAWAVSTGACRGVTVDTLSDQEKTDMAFMREEEKMARDLYTVFRQKYRDRIFGNIASSEQKHMDAILQLLKVYSQPDPVQPGLGQFSNQEITELYNQLYARGMKSRLEAYKVGVDVEKADIADLGRALSASDERCLDKTYLNLLQASKNHLRVFSAKSNTD